MRNKILSTISASMLFLAFGCTKQPYYNVPTDGSGSAVITEVAQVTSTGVTALDNEFTVDAYLPNANVGDEMQVELLKLQPPIQNTTDDQLLPLAGTQKKITIDASKKVTVTYTLADAKFTQVGEYVIVVFSGPTESGQIRIDFNSALNVNGPLFNGAAINLIRGAGDAFFDITVDNNNSDFSGNVQVKMKNGVNEPWQTLGAGTFAIPTEIPISSDDFATGKDTMYYSFVVHNGSLTDSVEKTVIISPSSFLVSHSGTMSAASAGFDLLQNSVKDPLDDNAVIATKFDGTMNIAGGVNWISDGNSIQFVPSDLSVFDDNNAQEVITAFNAGTPSNSITDVLNGGAYLFKITKTDGSVFFGILRITNLVPNESLQFDYRIGERYDQLSLIQ